VAALLAIRVGAACTAHDDAATVHDAGSAGRGASERDDSAAAGSQAAGTHAEVGTGGGGASQRADAGRGARAREADDAGDDADIAFSACCNATGRPGCADHGVEQCVCKTDPSCCSQAWDAFCVIVVGARSCGLCSP
jgi:hypothetical protein